MTAVPPPPPGPGERGGVPSAGPPRPAPGPVPGPPYPQQGPYPQQQLPHLPPYGPPGAPLPGDQSAKSLGIASVTVGVLGLPMSMCCLLVSWMLPLAALVTGAIGLTQAQGRSGAAYERYRTLYVVGIVLGVLGLALAVGFLLLGGLASIADTSP